MLRGGSLGDVVSKKQFPQNPKLNGEKFRVSKERTPFSLSLLNDCTVYARRAHCALRCVWVVASSGRRRKRRRQVVVIDDDDDADDDAGEDDEDFFDDTDGEDSSSSSSSSAKEEHRRRRFFLRAFWVDDEGDVEGRRRGEGEGL